MRHPRFFVPVVEIEHGANRIRRDPAVVLNQPFGPLLPVHKKVLWTEPRPLDDGLTAPLSRPGLDQSALGPVNVLHNRSLPRSRSGVLPTHGWKRPALLLLQRGQSSGVAGAMFLTADDITARDLGQCLRPRAA